MGELEPGTYIVRSGGGGLEDGSTLVPSYYKYGTTVATAEPVRVRLGETQAFVVIHTAEGQLFELTGNLTAPDNRPVRVSLITDMGRRLIASAAGPFTAVGVPPGPVELFAEGAGCAGYQRLVVDHNTFARIDCTPLLAAGIAGVGGDGLIARRADLDGPGAERAVSPGQTLTPGHWEFTVRTGTVSYLAALRSENDTAPPIDAGDGWFGIDIGNAPRLAVTLSDRPASVSGVVTSLGRPVIGAPVYLELLDTNAPELSRQAWSGRADERGNYVFGGLAPGVYRLVSGFDIDPDEPATKERAVTVTLREGDTVSQTLGLPMP